MISDVLHYLCSLVELGAAIWFISFTKPGNTNNPGLDRPADIGVGGARNCVEILALRSLVPSGERSS